MHPLLAKTFGGLSKTYYFRHFTFGLLFPLVMLAMWNSGSQPLNVPLAAYGLLAVNTVLYPYSRFVYESVVDFLIGSNVFVVNTFLMLGVKLITMMLCWSAAVFIAPIALIYLYVHHGREVA